MYLQVINAGVFSVDGGAMFGVVPKQLWRELVSVDEDNLTQWPMRSLLVDTGARRVLIDTGIGRKQDGKFLQRYRVEQEAPIEELVERAGIAREDVTDVILTHLHFDHSGGAVVERDGRLVPAFPNATCWVTASQWDAATGPNPRERASFVRDNFLPLWETGRLKFFSLAAWDIPEITCGVSNGHTAGQLIPRIRCAGRDLVFVADLVPSVHHIPLPYIMAYDLQPLVLLQEKSALLQEAAAGGHILFFEHDPTHECCTVCEGDRGVKVARVFDLKDAGLSD